MTRSENMKRVKALQKATTQAKIKALIDDSGLFECDFRHKDGQYKGLVNVPKLARYMDVSEMTIRRNLKDMEIR